MTDQRLIDVINALLAHVRYLELILANTNADAIHRSSRMPGERAPRLEDMPALPRALSFARLTEQESRDLADMG